MRHWIIIERAVFALLIAMTCVFFAKSARAQNCRLDWNGDFQIDESDYLVGDPMGGFYAEWYIYLYYPSYYPILFPGADSSRLDYVADGTINQDDLMGPLDAAAMTEGYYVEWYIFLYYPNYYPIFFPEYDVCPPEPPQSCADFEVIDVGGPSAPGLPWFFEELGGKLYFGAIDPVAGDELMVYDPATEAVTVASDINPGPGGSGVRNLTAHEGKLYFQANDFIGGYDAELFVFDPATGDSTKIDLNPDTSSLPTDFFSASNGLLYFRARDAIVGQELYEFDPVTKLYTIYEFIPGGDQFGNLYGGAPFVQLEHDGKLYMSAHGPEGKELYSFDLASKQIELEANIAPGTNPSGSHPLSSYPKELTLFNGEIFFNANKDGALDEELWIYNPITGDVREIEIDSGQAIHAGSLVPAGGSPTRLTEYDGKLYMRAQQVPVGVELFVYDPITDDVTLAWDSALGQYEFCSGPICLTMGNDGNTGELTLLNDKFYFSAPFDNRELWEWDPVTGQGQQLLEFYPGNDQAGNPGHGHPQHITVFDDKLFFRGNTDTIAEELIIVSWAPEHCQ